MKFCINVLWGYFEGSVWYPNLKLDISANEQYRQNVESLGRMRVEDLEVVC